ncbi:MAG: hypothetical protein ABNH53_03920 [Henriciella sp.]|jgi:hypothetical protein
MIAIPFVVLTKLVTWPFERPANVSPDEVAMLLRNFIEGTSGEWDFDDFISTKIANPKLDQIRVRASRLNLPILEEEYELWWSLVKDAESVPTDS